VVVAKVAHLSGVLAACPRRASRSGPTSSCSRWRPQFLRSPPISAAMAASTTWSPRRPTRAMASSRRRTSFPESRQVFHTSAMGVAPWSPIGRASPQREHHQVPEPAPGLGAPALGSSAERERARRAPSPRGPGLATRRAEPLEPSGDRRRRGGRAGGGRSQRLEGDGRHPHRGASGDEAEEDPQRKSDEGWPRDLRAEDPDCEGSHE
jgi:hypothetical protein